MTRNNLNLMTIPTETGTPVVLTDPGVTSASVTCHFREVKAALLNHMRKYDYLVGCIAWLTDPDLLHAFATRKGVAIIVQKEDFLRPDAERQARPDLRALYHAVTARAGELTRYQFPKPLCDMSICTDPSIGIRCVGNHNSARDPAFPRAHHKFLVFGHLERGKFVPTAVWTGSYNFTVTAGRSLENAVFIDDSTIAMAYLKEFSQVAAVSEPLDWETDWAEPEWRVGT